MELASAALNRTSTMGSAVGRMAGEGLVVSDDSEGPIPEIDSGPSESNSAG